MGGCAMVAQTLVNIGAVTILLIILVGGSVIEQIPIAALVGVMMMVAIGTFEWVSFRINSLFDNLQKNLAFWLSIYLCKFVVYFKQDCNLNK